MIWCLMLILKNNIMLNIQHPFIISLKHSLQTPEKFFLLMEYWCGGDLSSVIAKHESIPEKIAWIYTAEIYLAIEELHSRNIAYRDLKPANVLIGQDGHWKLTDFGLSKENMRFDTLTGSFWGSVAYLAPEVIK